VCVALMAGCWMEAVRLSKNMAGRPRFFSSPPIANKREPSLLSPLRPPPPLALRCCLTSVEIQSVLPHRVLPITLDPEPGGSCPRCRCRCRRNAVIGSEPDGGGGAKVAAHLADGVDAAGAVTREPVKLQAPSPNGAKAERRRRARRQRPTPTTAPAALTASARSPTTSCSASYSASRTPPPPPAGPASSSPAAGAASGRCSRSSASLHRQAPEPSPRLSPPMKRSSLASTWRPRTPPPSPWRRGSPPLRAASPAASPSPKVYFTGN
jgi:hypothetical protein